eukprot:TRINITY_DN21893_c0_g2_i3.p1 TRINITY_DN21893_c0_g2~~TRINITY_DN21893_c0_g2_i3.p1  ORF type:complete len:2987 (+),score=534.14 TRINITY_DN21893_c0_g2_i3:39-8963(+)
MARWCLAVVLCFQVHTAGAQAAERRWRSNHRELNKSAPLVAQRLLQQQNSEGFGECGASCVDEFEKAGGCDIWRSGGDPSTKIPASCTNDACEGAAYERCFGQKGEVEGSEIAGETADSCFVADKCWDNCSKSETCSSGCTACVQGCEEPCSKSLETEECSGCFQQCFQKPECGADCQQCFQGCFKAEETCQKEGGRKPDEHQDEHHEGSAQMPDWPGCFVKFDAECQPKKLQTADSEPGPALHICKDPSLFTPDVILDTWCEGLDDIRRKSQCDEYSFCKWDSIYQECKCDHTECVAYAALSRDPRLKVGYRTCEKQLEDVRRHSDILESVLRVGGPCGDVQTKWGRLADSMRHMSRCCSFSEMACQPDESMLPESFQPNVWYNDHHIRDREACLTTRAAEFRAMCESNASVMFNGPKCETESNQQCVFPFTFNNVTYRKCTYTNSPGAKAWCSLETDADGNHAGQWNYCDQHHRDCLEEQSADPPQCHFKLVPRSYLLMATDGEGEGEDRKAAVMQGDELYKSVTLEVECNLSATLFGQKMHLPERIYVKRCERGFWDQERETCMRCPEWRPDDEADTLPEGFLKEEESIGGGCHEDHNNICFCDIKKRIPMPGFEGLPPKDFVTNVSGPTPFDEGMYYYEHFQRRVPAVEACTQGDGEEDEHGHKCWHNDILKHSWSMHNMRSFEQPMLRCDPSVKFAVGTGRPQVRMLPPVADDALYTYLHMVHAYGFNASLDAPFFYNRMNIEIMESVYLQGNPIKIGPDLEELLAGKCTLDLAAYTEAGKPMLQEAVNFKDVGVRELECTAEAMLEVKTNVDGLLAMIESLGQSNIRCTSEEEPKRRLQGELVGSGALSEREQDFEHFLQRRLQTAQGDPNNSSTGSDASNPWAQFDGIRCNQKREIIERTMSSALNRAFIYTGSDAYSACKHVLDQWSTYAEVTKSETTRECTTPKQNADGLINKEWLEDPCCNSAMRTQMCCAPRVVNRTRTVVTGVDEAAIAAYAKKTGQGSIAVAVAMQYMKMENEAARTCFQPFIDFYTATKDIWAIVDKCYREIENPENQRQCTTDSDCWTRECRKPAKVGAAGGGGVQKKCRSAMESESKDLVTPLIRCMIGSSPAAVSDYFEYMTLAESKQLSLDTFAGIAESVRRMPDMIKEECRGDGHESWSMQTEEACLEQKRCNWKDDVNDAEVCMDPCGGAGGACPQFCTLKGKHHRGESSRFAQCKPRLEHTFEMRKEKCEEERRQVEEQLSRICDSCRDQCRESERFCHDERNQCHNRCNERNWEQERQEAQSSTACVSCTNSCLSECVDSTCGEKCGPCLDKCGDDQECRKSCLDNDQTCAPHCKECALRCHCSTCSQADVCGEATQECCWEVSSACHRNCWPNEFKRTGNCSGADDECGSCLHGRDGKNGCTSYLGGPCVEGREDSAACQECQAACVSSGKCTNSCIGCMFSCDSEAFQCAKDKSHSPEDACRRDCDDSFPDDRCHSQSKTCIAECSETESCKKRDGSEARRQCMNGLCSSFKDGAGGSATVDPQGDSCIFPNLSFDTRHEATCKEECLGADGPQPAAARRCVGVLDQALAKQGTCQKLGEGWIEERVNWEDPAYQDWDWSRGHPPPQFCWIKRYTALGGKPYVSPPPYGKACKEPCERELDSCLHDEECHVWLEDLQQSLHGFCRQLFDQNYSGAFWECEHNTPCSGETCLTKRADCAKKVGLLDDPLFKEAGCERCHGDWMSWDFRGIMCAQALTLPECQWKGDFATSQPCAQGCIHSMCHELFEDCRDKGQSRLHCSKEVMKLNQCRECEFVRCENKCERTACKDFDWWGQPEEECGGCLDPTASENSTDDNDSAVFVLDTSNMCFLGQPCFSDRKCYGEQPPFGEACPRKCENQLQKCRDSWHRACEEEPGLRETCEDEFGRREFEFDQCLEDTRQAFWENEGGDWTQRHEFDSHIACGLVIFPQNHSCRKCEGRWVQHGTYWEAVAGPDCLNGVTKNDKGEPFVSADCRSKCFPERCPSLSTQCHHMIHENRSCDHRDMSDYHVEICAMTYADAVAAVVRDHPECAGCQKHCDRHRCQDSACSDTSVFASWSDPKDSCGGCPATYACSPGKECFIEETSPVIPVIDDSVWDKLSSKIDRCFPRDVRRLSASGPGMLAKSAKSVQGLRFRDRAVEEEQRLKEEWRQQWNLASSQARRLQARVDEQEVNADSFRRLRGATTQNAKSADASQLVELKRELAAVLARKERLSRKLGVLKEEQPVEVDLQCVGADCAKQEALCSAFFDASGDNAARMAVVESHSFVAAPWENQNRICENLGSMCYISLPDARAMLLEKDSPERENCEREKNDDTARCLQEECGACGGTVNPNYVTQECNWCCRCSSDRKKALEALLHHRSNDVCSLLDEHLRKYSSSRAQDYVWFDDRLLNGQGACQMHLNEESFKPQECHEPQCHDPGSCPQCSVELSQDFCPAGLKFFKLSHVWEEPFLGSKEACEAEACSPEPWARTEERCEGIRHCEGDCPYCETREYWNREDSQNRVVCHFLTLTGGYLSESECKSACGGSFTDTCYMRQNPKTNTAYCVTVPKTGAQGETVADRCKAGGVETIADKQVRWNALQCSDVARLDCSWAATALPELECGIERMQCKNRADCESSGRCEYRVDDWQVEMAGGFCVLPHPPSELSAHEPHEACRRLRPNITAQLLLAKKDTSQLRVEAAPYGCAVFFEDAHQVEALRRDPSQSVANSSELQTSRRNVCTDTVGGKWFPYGFTSAECSVPGFAWARTPAGTYGSGTHMCCLQWWGQGAELECELFSMDSDIGKCSACGGRWMSIFRFRVHGRWIEGKWGKAYDWRERAFSSVNTWMPVVQRWKLEELWDRVVQQVRARPLTNFVQCRMNPTLASLLAIATNELPTPKLGDFGVLPMKASSTKLGSVTLESTAGTNTGTQENLIAVSVDSARNSLPAAGNVSGEVLAWRRLR